MRLSPFQPSTQPESSVRNSTRSRHLRAGVGVLASMAVVSACAGGVTGVTSKSLTTDVDFGLPASASPTPFVTASAAPAAPVAAPVAPAVAAPAAPPPAALLPAPAMVTQPVAAAPVAQAPTSVHAPTSKPQPSDDGDAPIVGPGAPTQAVTESKCPVAPYGSSAALLTIDVTKTPAVGSYREIYTSSQVVGSNTVSSTSYLTMDVTDVSAVTSLPNPDQGGNTTRFTFETVLHLANGVLETDTWQVKNNSPYRNESAGNVGAAVGVGEPDRGIALESVVITDKTGATTGSSSYSPGVLEQPLPVDVGQTFTGEGADTSGGTLAFDGRELDVKHLDACGTLVDSYEDTGNQVAVNQQTQTQSTLDVAFATNLGGLPVYMQGIDATSGQMVTLQLGQATPSPLGTDRS